jgi:carbamoyl-phosphate synthase (ammonia)
MGGQTALNCAVEMYLAGTFKVRCRSSWNSIDSVINTRTDSSFGRSMRDQRKVAGIYTTNTIAGAVRHAKKLGYPLMIRSAFALRVLEVRSAKTSRNSTMARRPLRPQILVGMKGWEGVEYGGCPYPTIASVTWRTLILSYTGETSIVMKPCRL